MVEIQLNGKPLRLKYRMKEIQRLHQEYDVNLMSFIMSDASSEEIEKTFLAVLRDPQKATAILWAGLLWEDGERTLDSVAESVTLGELLKLQGPIAEALLEGAPSGPFPNPTTGSPKPDAQPSDSATVPGNLTA